MCCSSFSSSFLHHQTTLTSDGQSDRRTLNIAIYTKLSGLFDMRREGIEVAEGSFKKSRNSFDHEIVQHDPPDVAVEVVEGVEAHEELEDKGHGDDEAIVPSHL